MKVFQKGLIVVCAALALAACASTKPVQKSVVLDSKGAARGLEAAWVDASISGGNIAVEALPEYKDFYCFVLSAESKDKDFLLAWTGNLNGPALIANTIATTISQNVVGPALNVEGAEKERIITTNQEMLSNASYTGARKMADWWQLVRNKDSKEERYEAFVLYTFGKKVLDDQIARHLQNIVDDKNKALSDAEKAIYAELINEIRVNGFQNR